MSLTFLRPPGTKPERDFLSLCIQCGQCAQICPYKTIKLRTGLNLLVSGTPQIFPAETPCYLCMRCPPVCPSGALQELDITEVRMGRAKIDRSQCFTWSGLVICRSCYERCPLKGKAIELQKGLYPVITEHCAGCGICEYVCPRKCITTTPARLLGKSRPRPKP